MLKTNQLKNTHEVKHKKKKPGKKTSSASHKKPSDIKPAKNSENQEQKSVKKPPLSKKPSLPCTKPACLTPKSPSKPTKKRILLQNLPSGAHYSDTEKSTKRIEKARAQSNLEHSLKTRMELSQKVLLKNTTSPCRVEEIIRCSLKKAKRQKLSKERDAKQKLVMNEIKKLEQEQHNNLIRQLNLQKLKKKKLQIGKKEMGKSKLRSNSSRRPGRDKSQTMRNMRSNSVGREYFASDLRPAEGNYIERGYEETKIAPARFGTYRESVRLDEATESEREDTWRPLRYGRVRRNISLIDTGELVTYMQPDFQEPQEKTKKVKNYEFQESKPKCEEFEVVEEGEKEDMKRKRGAEETSGIKEIQVKNKEERSERKQISGRGFKEKSESKQIQAKEVNEEEKESEFIVKKSLPENILGLKPLPDKHVESSLSSHHDQPSIQASLAHPHLSATKIQRAFRRFLHKSSETHPKKPDLHAIIKDQLGWREAQLLSLEYLRSKEIEDLQSLTELLGRNSGIEELLLKTVNQRYEQFTKVFKENLEDVETAMLEEMDVDEVMDFSNQIKMKKSVVSKIIQVDHMNSSLSKNEFAIAVREAMAKEPGKENEALEEVDKGEREVEIIQNEVGKPIKSLKSVKPLRKLLKKSQDCCGETKSIKEEKALLEESPVVLMKEDLIPQKAGPSEIIKDVASCKDLLDPEEELIFPSSFPKKPATPATLSNTSSKPHSDSNQKTISLSDLPPIEATMLSPIFPDAISFPLPTLNHQFTPNSPTSPLPDRPSAPMMFLDIDDCNISLESLLNSSTPLNRKPLPGLPLLNLGNLPTNTYQQLTSDPRIETHPDFIRKFSIEVFENIDKEKLLTKLRTGIIRDPIETLSKIYELELGNVLDSGTYPPILDIADIVEKTFEECLSEDIVSTQRFVNQADRIHKLMILTVADEVLQKFRPYGIKGVPMLWSGTTRILMQTPLDIEQIIELTVNEIEDLSRYQIGKIATEEMILSNGHIDEELLQDIREDSLAYAIRQEILEKDWIWTDYEVHETQIKIDLADMMLNELVGEILLLGL